MERIESPEIPTFKTEDPQPPQAIKPRHENSEMEIHDHDKERDCISISTVFSTETATVQHAEKLNVGSGLPTPDSLSEKDFGMLEASTSLQLNFGSKFSLGGMGLSRNNTAMPSKGSLDIPAQPNEIDAGSVHSGGSVKVGDVDVSMDAKSALDRLMDDVAGAGGRDDDSIMTEDIDKSYDQSLEIIQPPKVQRATTDSDLLHTTNSLGSLLSRPSIESIPPPPPPKDNIKAREQLILEKRREARRVEEGGFVPTRKKGQGLQARLGVGRPSRRRSMSADDAQELAKKQLLSVGGDMENLTEEDLLSQSIERELMKLDRTGSGRKSVGVLIIIISHSGAHNLINRNIMFGNAKAPFMPRHRSIKLLICPALET
jgi:hypothetical protein